MIRPGGVDAMLITDDLPELEGGKKTAVRPQPLGIIFIIDTLIVLAIQLMN